MNTIISTYEYEELLKKNVKKNLHIGMYAMMAVALLEAAIVIPVSFATGGFEDQIDMYAIFALPVAFLLVSLVLYMLSRSVDHRKVIHYSLPLYMSYESEGTKVPLYRLTQQGKNQDTVYLIMDLIEDHIHVYDIRRKKTKMFLDVYKSQSTFRFYFKTKNGEDIIKEKFDLVVNGRKNRLYGLKGVNSKLISFLRTEGYQTEIIRKQKNTSY